MSAVKPSRLYCGHGPCIGPLGHAATEPTADGALELSSETFSPAIVLSETGVERIETYIKHRFDRERMVLDAVKPGHSLTPAGIASIIYKDALPPDLFAAATGVIALHCEKVSFSPSHLFFSFHYMQT
jgi:hypothetical protein